MIKNFRARVMVDPRGKIKTGMMAKTPEGKQYPRSLDYFNLEPFPELKEAYGQKPASLVVMFPADEPFAFFDCNFEHWGGRKAENQAGTLIRRCDGETCIHRINETIGSKTYAAGEESICICPELPETIVKNGKEIPNPDKCKYSAYLKAWVLLPQTGKIENPKCYLFETHSQNSGDAIFSALNDVRILTGGILRGIPFALSVRMVSGKTDAKQKFPIWTLIPIGTVSQMRESSRRLLSAENGVAMPVMAALPQSTESPVVAESRRRRETFENRLKDAKVAADLTRIKTDVNKDVDLGNLIQKDYDDLLEAMKLKYNTWRT